ncbi:MAG: DUF3872 domain-containing protein [Bacteroides sp.]|nr:DUF3872 domain-containing protein [Bacteroides sp.]
MTSNLISRISAIRVTSSRFFLRSTTKALRDYFGFFLRFTPKGLCGCWLVVAAVLLALTSCSDDLDVQQSYPFTVEVMPFGDKIAKGETVELRFEIKLEGNYTNTMYTIRYFQYDGEGTLKLVDGPTLVNNDRVLIESKSFRLNYTANTSDAHKFLIVVDDNFGSTPWEQTFDFNSKDSNDKGSSDLVIVGPIDTPIMY